MTCADRRSEARRGERSEKLSALVKMTAGARRNRVRRALVDAGARAKIFEKSSPESFASEALYPISLKCKRRFRIFWAAVTPARNTYETPPGVRPRLHLHWLSCSRDSQ